MAYLGGDALEAVKGGEIVTMDGQRHDITKKERFNMLLLAITVSAGVAWLLLKWLEAIEYDEE